MGVGVQAPPAVTAAATPPAMATLQDDELQAFVEDQCNENTKKTKSDLGKWYRWCQSVGENRRLDELPHEDLDRLLGHFFMKVRKNDGTLYEPDSLPFTEALTDTCEKAQMNPTALSEIHSIHHPGKRSKLQGRV